MDIKVDLGDVGCARWESCAVGAEVFGAQVTGFAVTKKAGSKEYGKAVYLNEAELKATQELISMGKKIYIQMVPSSPIEHASFEN